MAYWSFLLYEANLAAWRWIAGNIGAALVSAFCTSVGLMALFSWGSADGFRDQWIMIGGGVLGAVLVYVAIFIWQAVTLPPALHDAHRRTIEALTAKHEALIMITADPAEHEKFEWEFDPDSKGPEYRVIVRNNSTTKTVDGVRVTLLRVKRNEANISWKGLIADLEVADQPGVYEVTLNPQREAAFRLYAARWATGADGTTGTNVLVAPGSKAERLTGPEGLYFFRVKAHGKDTMPDEKTLRVDYRGTATSMSVVEER